MKKKQNRMVLGILITVFMVYNVILYTQNISSGSVSMMSDDAIRGEALWQDNNCTACHQIYGLGGYLGPDLTNVISNPTKGENYVKSFLNSGTKSMPKFKFTEEEKESIVSYLKHIDNSGYYPNKNAEFESSGWVSIQYK